MIRLAAQTIFSTSSEIDTAARINVDALLHVADRCPLHRDMA
jgi:hypothetical protein